jgi:hypothetical protein
MEDPDNPEDPHYCKIFWDKSEQNMLESYQRLMAEQVEHPSSVLTGVEHRMEIALKSFMRYSRRDKSWRRMQEADVHTRLRVDHFCGNVMACVSMGRGECRERGVENVWVQRLQTVMGIAQRMFQNINEEITVGIVEWEGHTHNTLRDTPTTHIINTKHTLQETVSEEYAVFPGMCWFILKTPGL